jgi:aspartate aminotransferase
VPSRCCTTWPKRLLDEGDEICFAAPYWTTYHDIADIVGAKATCCHCGPSQNYKLTPAQLETALARKPKVFLFNNPSNPTGMVYTREEIAALADVLVKYPDTWIVTDDIYNSMVFDGIGYHNFVFARPSCASVWSLSIRCPRPTACRAGAWV